MGLEQRSRQFLPPETTCYLCGQPIVEGDAWDRDHVPPQRFYGKSIRASFNPRLNWLYAHRTCNGAYRSDEEYFVTSFAGHAKTPTGRAVFDDIRRAAAKGHEIGLLKTIVGQFGKVQTSDGLLLFSYDAERSGRVTWKLVHGLYFAATGRVLPEGQPKRMIMLGPDRVPRAESEHPWWTVVRDTAPMGAHGAVFDYKWLGTILDGARGNAIAMLLWDQLLILVLFHDPSCSCPECVADDRSTAARG